MLVVGDIVSGTLDVTGRLRNTVGEVFSVTATGWGDVRYDVLCPEGAFRFSERHVTLDVEATVAAGIERLGDLEGTG